MNTNNERQEQFIIDNCESAIVEMEVYVKLNDVLKILPAQSEQGDGEIEKYLHDAWPLHDVLNKLIEATEILFDKKDYDGFGWEEILHAKNKAKEILSNIKPPQPQEQVSQIEEAIKWVSNLLSEYSTYENDFNNGSKAILIKVKKYLESLKKKAEQVSGEGEMPTAAEYFTP